VLDGLMSLELLDHAAPSKTGPPRREKALSTAVPARDDFARVRTRAEPSWGQREGLEITMSTSWHGDKARLWGALVKR
jgi:hypothetical protein